MSLLRNLIVVLLVLAWVPATTHCILEVELLQRLDVGHSIAATGAHCSDEGQSGGHEGSGCAECAVCSSLERGQFKNAVAKITVALPMEDESWRTAAFIALLAPPSPRLYCKAEEYPTRLSANRSLWQFVASAVAPVRGPSYLA